MSEDSSELDYSGCHGEKVKYPEMIDFLEESFQMNYKMEDKDQEKFSTCIWGHAGIGKSAAINAFKYTPVTWQGKEYDGYNVVHVPVAQFEEMGDLHGMPERHVYMRKGEEEGQWVPEKIIPQYQNIGWEVEIAKGTRTMYAPPDWVPSEPGPAILHLEDWNRAGVRIVKGLMQLLQTYGMVSWRLPPGCHIVMTGNPDEQDYLVTSIDSAILTRIEHITLKHDEKAWAIWAEGQKLDHRGINFVLRYPEATMGDRTNPRTLTRFFRYLENYPILNNDNRKKVINRAHSLLDEETVNSLIVFIERDMEMIVEPDEILRGEAKAIKHIQDLMNRDEKRVDVLGVICERLYARIIQPDTEAKAEHVKNFQKFLTLEEIPEDMRHSICRRLVTANQQKGIEWLAGNKILKEMIVETMR